MLRPPFFWRKCQSLEDASFLHLAASDGFDSSRSEGPFRMEHDSTPKPFWAAVACLAMTVDKSPVRVITDARQRATAIMLSIVRRERSLCGREDAEDFVATAFADLHEPIYSKGDQKGNRKLYHFVSEEKLLRAILTCAKNRMRDKLRQSLRLDPSTQNQIHDEPDLPVQIWIGRTVDRELRGDAEDRIARTNAVRAVVAHLLCELDVSDAVHASNALAIVRRQCDFLETELMRLTKPRTENDLWVLPRAIFDYSSIATELGLSRPDISSARQLMEKILKELNKTLNIEDILELISGVENGEIGPTSNEDVRLVRKGG